MVNQVKLWNAIVVDAEKAREQKRRELDQIELMNIFVRDAEKNKRKGLTNC